MRRLVSLAAASLFIILSDAQSVSQRLEDDDMLCSTTLQASCTACKQDTSCVWVQVNDVAEVCAVNDISYFQNQLELTNNGETGAFLTSFSTVVTCSTSTSPPPGSSGPSPTPPASNGPGATPGGSTSTPSETSSGLPIAGILLIVAGCIGILALLAFSAYRKAQTDLNSYNRSTEDQWNDENPKEVQQLPPPPVMDPSLGYVSPQDSEYTL